jgi:hypothetical protein
MPNAEEEKKVRSLCLKTFFHAILKVVTQFQKEKGNIKTKL